MIRILVFLLSLSSTMAIADTTAGCEVVQGRLPNSLLQPGAITLMSISDDFSLVTAGQLSVDAWGRNYLFNRLAVSAGQGTKLDYALESNPAVRAVFLLEQTPAEAYESNAFSGILIITGVNASATQPDGASWIAERSLVYSLACKVN